MLKCSQTLQKKIESARIKVAKVQMPDGILRGLIQKKKGKVWN